MPARALLASPLGFVVGLSLGTLGGGGSILALPALVYVAGQTPKQAAATSLVLVATASLVGVVPHWRAGRVRFVPGLLFGLAGVAGNLLGSHWNKSVNPDVLLLAFAGLMAVAAVGMWRRAVNARPAPRPVGAAVASPRPKLRVDVALVVKVLVLGSAVGLLTGFFGVGGGFVIVPSLVLALGFGMPEAVGTSLVVITINSFVALSQRLHGNLLDWSVVVPFTIAAVLGVLTGSRIAGRVPAEKLARWFVFLLVGVAAYTAVNSILALT